MLTQYIRQDRELQEWKEAFDELEKERDETVRKACEQERADMKGENDAVQSFLGKLIEENDVLQEKVALAPCPLSCAYLLSSLCWHGRRSWHAS